MNKLTYIVYGLIVACIGWLVAVDMGRSGAIDVFMSKTSYNKLGLRRETLELLVEHYLQKIAGV